MSSLFIALQSRRHGEPVFLQACHPVNCRFFLKIVCVTYT
jgi:DNA-binding cell septation regulator SpoVG